MSLLWAVGELTKEKPAIAQVRAELFEDEYYYVEPGQVPWLSGRVSTKDLFPSRNAAILHTIQALAAKKIQLEEQIQYLEQIR